MSAPEWDAIQADFERDDATAFFLSTPTVSRPTAQGCPDGLPWDYPVGGFELQRSSSLPEPDGTTLLGVCIGVAPALCRSTKSGLVVRPIVDRRGVEVRSARPDDRMNLRVESDLGKNRWVAEWAVKLALENPLAINGADQSVVETQSQRMRLDALDRGDAAKQMVHGTTPLQRCDWGRLAAQLQKLPGGKQRLLVKLRPSLDETLLSLGE